MVYMVQISRKRREDINSSFIARISNMLNALRILKKGIKYSISLINLFW